MQSTNERNRGLVFTAAGIAVVAFAVFMMGLTEMENGASSPDWAAIITAIAGAVIVVRGLSMTLHHG